VKEKTVCLAPKHDEARQPLYLTLCLKVLAIKLTALRKVVGE
jgi:hypothetical protein